MSKESKQSYLNFNNKDYAWKNDINYRLNPSAYKVGKGEQGAYDSKSQIFLITIMILK